MPADGIFRILNDNNEGRANLGFLIEKVPPCLLVLAISPVCFLNLVLDVHFCAPIFSTRMLVFCFADRHPR